MKTCIKCHVTKDDIEFRWRVLNVRRDTTCRICKRLSEKTPKKREQNKQAGIKYLRTEYGKIKSRERCRKFRETQAFKLSVEKTRLKHPEKRAAQIIFSNAIACGRIIRPNQCSICNTICKPDRHHYDYTLPLDVIWVCTSCHKAYYHRPKNA